MATNNFNPPDYNGQPTKSQQFEQAFCSQDSDNRIDLIVFLTRRIVAFARLSSAALSPVKRQFWQGQITTYHAQLKQAMTNPAFREGDK